MQGFALVAKLRLVAIALVLIHTWINLQPYGFAFCAGATNLARRDPISRLALDSNGFAYDQPKIVRPFPTVRNLYEKLTFSWARDLMVAGNAKPLDIEDIWLLQESKRMRNISETFDRLFREEAARTPAQPEQSKGNLLTSYWESPITRATVKMYKAELLTTGALKLVNTLVQFTPSLLVSRILKYIGKGKQPTATLGPVAAALLQTAEPHLPPLAVEALTRLLALASNEGFQLSVLLFLSLSTKTLIENQYFDGISQLSAEVRGALSTAVYRKALKLSPASRANNTIGEIVNYMQLDTSRLEHVVHSIHTVWDGALQILGYTALLVQFLGPSVFAGLAAMLVILPLNSYFLRRISKLREANLQATDRRVKLTNELLQGIRAIKSYNWEAPFAAQLGAIRDSELHGLKSAANMRSLLVSTLSTAPSIVAVVSLATYALLGNELSATKVFTSLALFNQLRFPLIFYPMLLNSLAEGKVSLRRLTQFLMTEEVQNYVESGEPLLGTVEGEEATTATARRRSRDAVRITNGTFTWGSLTPSLLPAQVTSVMHTDANGEAVNITIARNRDQLQNVNISIRRGQLVAVIGPTGSGKSTLLHALLGELNKCDGSVMVKGRVAYVPQSTWIPNDTLRNVILFGKPYEPARYAWVLRMCGLVRDLELLEAGDQTEIGERGVNLSGGQKQRVSVARAVYDDAEVYLFDDPLSALDNSVGARLFMDCIKRGLAGKTRILVTHQLGVLSQVDRIVLMDQSGEGGACRILDQGTLRDLLRRGHDLTKYVTEKPIAPEEEMGNVSPAAEGITSAAVEATVTLPVQGNITMAESAKAEIVASTVPPTGALIEPTVSRSEVTEDTPCAGEKSPPGTGDPKQPFALLEETGERLIRITQSHPASVATTTAKLAAPQDKSLVSQMTTEVKGSDCTVVADADKRERNQLIRKEERAEGAVGTHVYQAYVAAANKPMLLALVLLSVVMSNVSLMWQQWVVAAWTSDAQYASRPLAAYLGGVTVTALMVGTFNYLRTYFGVLFGVAASRTIHRRMIDRVLHAPLAFFESTPVGRLVQRFSKDLDQIDQQLPSSISQLLSSTFSIANCVAAIAMVTPSFAVLLVVILGAYIRVTNYYRTVARELKRVEALSRTPIYTHFSETLGGLSVIRSYRRQAVYLRNNEARLDDNVSAHITLKTIDRWLCVRLEMLGNAIVLFAAALATLSGSKAGPAGLSLNNALGVTSLLNWAVRCAAETEALMNSVERVSYTINETPRERPAVVQAIDPSAAGLTTSLGPDAITLHTVADKAPATDAKSGITLSDKTLLESGWPYAGEIALRGVRMRYRSDFEEVLKGVDLLVKPGERVGIVGRTGSGKSSLFRALLRLTELEQGSIDIDGVVASQIGLDALRSSVSIIPQDPVLFSGTIRFNLDPFNVHTDSQLWAALRKANLDRTVIGLPGALRYEVSEGGDNFSLGQRQLLCLARALVRRSRILLLDEATSSVDFATDALIQQTIRKEFGDGTTTVLIIAHRLDSVLDADRIVVMDAGRVAECAPPSVLLSNPDSLFAQLVAAERPNETHGEVEEVIEVLA